jgi:chromate reductase
VKVLGISGSLRQGSFNTQLLRAAADVVPFGVEIELYDELELVPPYNQDRDTETSASVSGSPRRTPF